MIEQFNDVCKPRFDHQQIQYELIKKDLAIQEKSIDRVEAAVKFANKDIKEIREKLFNGHSTAVEKTIPEAIKRIEKQTEKTDGRVWWILGSVILGILVSIVLKFV